MSLEEQVSALARFPSENPNPVLRVDRDGTILYANDASLPLLNAWGCQTGQRLPDDLRALASDVLRSGSTRAVEAEHGDRIIALTLAPIVDAGYVNVYGLDVTDREEAEEAVRTALEDSRRRRAETAALLEASRAVLEHHEFEPAARAIFDACKAVVGARAGYVALLSADGSENEVVFLDPGGLPCDVDPSLPMPIRGLREEAYRLRKAVYENDFSKSAWVKFMPEGHAELHAVMFAPLVIQAKVIGLIGLANKPEGFTDADASLASAFADLAAVALRNAWVQESLAHSEERFRSVAQSAAEAIITIDKQGNVVFWNSAAEEMLGYAADEMIGKPLTLIIPQRYQQAHDEAMKRLASTGEANLLGKTVELTGLRRDGSEFPLELSLAQWETREGVFFTGIVRDITERKRSEDQLAQMLEQIEKHRNDLLSILNRLSLGTAITDANGRITFLSEAARRVFAKKQKDILGRHWEALLPTQQAEKARLRTMCERPPEDRDRVVVHVEASGRRHYWIDVDVQDDPRDPQRKIFVFYDTSEVHDLRRMLHGKAAFHDLIGKSSPMQQVYQLIRKLAEVDCSVLLEGETGTGKELVARAIHFSGHRKEKPFIAVNCGGLTESLLGSQLFGHKRGAFTGATEDHTGLFEEANGGTLMLDEIGDIPPSVQASLLRVLQEKEILRLGESRPRKIDVRLIAATNRDLGHEVNEGRFRLDLLYRIRVARIELPPLRERREDIPLLVGSFLSKTAATTGKNVQEVSTDAMRMLMDHSWPGNVRELLSAVEFAVIGAKGSVIQAGDLPPELVSGEDARRPLQADQEGPSPSDTITVEERARVVAALEAAKGNRSAAARLLGISRATLYRRLTDMGLAHKQ